MKSLTTGGRLLRHQARTVGRIPDRPSQLGQPIPQHISATEVLRRPRFLSFLHQPLSFGVGLSTPIWLSKGAEADQLQHLRNRPSCLSPIHLATIGFTDQLEDLGERPRRVEVIRERVLERFESLSGSIPSARGGVAGPSPLFARRPPHRRSPAVVWGPLPRHPQPLVPKEVPQPLNPSNRFLHLLLPKRQRLPVVPG